MDTIRRRGFPNEDRTTLAEHHRTTFAEQQGKTAQKQSKNPYSGCCQQIHPHLALLHRASLPFAIVTDYFKTEEVS